MQQVLTSIGAKPDQDLDGLTILQQAARRPSLDSDGRAACCVAVRVESSQIIAATWSRSATDPSVATPASSVAPVSAAAPSRLVHAAGISDLLPSGQHQQQLQAAVRSWPGTRSDRPCSRCRGRVI
jgi:hypothetical protein